LARALGVFSKHLLQSRYVQYRVSQKTSQFGILVLKRLQALGVGHVDAAIIRASFAKRRITDAVPSAQLNGRHPSLMLLQYFPMICSSLKRDRFMFRLLLRRTDQPNCEDISGEQITYRLATTEL